MNIVITAIDDLILELDSNINSFPCFIPMPMETNFRIGIEEGPCLKFYKENKTQYNLYLRGDSEYYATHIPIIHASHHFMEFQKLYYKIRSVIDSEPYKSLRDTPENLAKMLQNLNPFVIRYIQRFEKCRTGL